MPEHTRLEEIRARQAAARAQAAQDLDADPDGSSAHLARMEIEHCQLCDADGYRGNRVCDHREHSTPAGRAAAIAMFRDSRKDAS